MRARGGSGGEVRWERGAGHAAACASALACIGGSESESCERCCLSRAHIDNNHRIAVYRPWPRDQIPGWDLVWCMRHHPARLRLTAASGPSHFHFSPLDIGRLFSTLTSHFRIHHEHPLAVHRTHRITVQIPTSATRPGPPLNLIDLPDQSHAPTPYQHIKANANFTAMTSTPREEGESASIS